MARSAPFLLLALANAAVCQRGDSFSFGNASYSFASSPEWVAWCDSVVAAFPNCEEALSFARAAGTDCGLSSGSSGSGQVTPSSSSTTTTTTTTTRAPVSACADTSSGCGGDAWEWNCKNHEPTQASCPQTCATRFGNTCDYWKGLAGAGGSTGGGNVSVGGGNTGGSVGGGSGTCRKGAAADGTYMGYAPARKPERDGTITRSGENITVNTAPAVPVGCQVNVSLPQAGQTYHFKEYYTMIGKAKLLCNGWDEAKHAHIMRKTHTSGNCTGRNAFTYDNLAMAAGMFPDFAGSDHAVTNALEIAAFMANSSKETTGGWASEGYSGWGWCFSYEVGFPTGAYGGQSNYNNNNCQAWWGTVSESKTSSFDIAAKNQGYYGRGAIQLTHCYNYGWFRNWVENFLELPRVPERDFLANPGFVAEEWPFVSGLWFWMSPESSNNKPSMHSIVYMWTPNGQLSKDNVGRENDFGYLPNILNGGFECGSSGHHGPKIRNDYMAEYMELMGVDTSQYQNHLKTTGGCTGHPNMGDRPFLNWVHPDGSKDGGDTKNIC